MNKTCDETVSRDQGEFTEKLQKVRAAKERFTKMAAELFSVRAA